MLTKEQIMTALKEIIDWEIGLNIVDLGLIYDLKVNNSNVYVKMTLTAPGCPMHSMFVKQVEEKIKKLGAEDVKVELTFDPPWTPDRLSEEAKKMLGLK